MPDPFAEALRLADVLHEDPYASFPALAPAAVTAVASPSTSGLAAHSPSAETTLVPPLGALYGADQRREARHQWRLAVLHAAHQSSLPVVESNHGEDASSPMTQGGPTPSLATFERAVRLAGSADPALREVGSGFDRESVLGLRVPVFSEVERVKVEETRATKKESMPSPRRAVPTRPSGGEADRSGTRTMTTTMASSPRSPSRLLFVREDEEEGGNERERERERETSGRTGIVGGTPGTTLTVETSPWFLHQRGDGTAVRYRTVRARQIRGVFHERVAAGEEVEEDEVEVVDVPGPRYEDGQPVGSHGSWEWRSAVRLVKGDG